MSELKGKAIEGIRWTSLSAVVTAGGGLLQTLILVRLLERADFGLMALLNVVLGLSVQLVDMGFGTALLREKNPTRGMIDTIFTLNTALGLLFGLLIACIASWIAGIYDEPRLQTLLWWSTPAFLFSGMAMFYQTMLQKHFRFRHLAVTEIIAFIVSFATAILLALSGWGVFALVCGVLVKTFATASMTWLLGRSLHRPTLAFNWVEIKPLWQFSYLQTMEKFINYANINFDNLVIGKALGKEILGVYDVCKRLLIQPMYVVNPIITKVSGPVMVQVQDDIPRMRNIALRAFQMAVTINAPLYMASFIGAGFIVPVLFGSKWASGVEPFRWLALVYFVRSLINPLGGVVIAKNKVEYGLYSQIFISVGLIASILIGLKGGLILMLQMLLGIYMLLVVGFLYFAIKPLIKIKLPEMVSWMGIELMTALFSFGTSYLMVQMMSTGWIKMITFALAGSMLYAFLLVMFRPGLRSDIRQILKR
ncbi:MAG: MOP flippase family protein [Saprospiraceae bacterium]|nr:MOP flippase family protein [Saprospiraceae bacterium]